jgi:cyanophycinase
MPGLLLLAGGAEFGGRMADPDRMAIAEAGGPNAPIRVIPAAAAPDNNDARAGRNAVAWFESLGAHNVVALPLVDARSAADPAIVDQLRAARLIYMLGGFPDHLLHTLLASAAWNAALDAYAHGAVLGGSSAGAMVMCRWLYNPRSRTVVDGLGCVPEACVLPHHDSYGQRWAAELQLALPGATLIGIDERTAMLGRPGEIWRIAGQGGVTLYQNGTVQSYRHDLQL